MEFISKTKGLYRAIEMIRSPKIHINNSGSDR